MFPEPIDSSKNLSYDSLPYLKIFQSLPGMHLLLSSDLVVQWVSNGYLKETMLTREAIVGKLLFQVFPESDERFESNGHGHLPTSLQLVLQTKQAHQMGIHSYKLPDPHRVGEYLQRYWRTTNTPVLDEKGEVLCIILQTENVTEKVRVEHQLAESQLREQEAATLIQQRLGQFNPLFEQAPVAITILQGEQYIVQLANQSVLEIWARSKEEVVGKPLFEAMPEIRQQGLEELLEQVRSSGQAHIGKELPIELNRHGNLETLYFNFVYQPLSNEKGTITGIAVVATDVTELVAARKAIETRATQLRELNLELENRVASWTRQLVAAKAEAEAGRNRLHHLLMQAPGVIAVLQGPEHLCELANPGCQELFGGQDLLGKTIREILPQNQNQKTVALLDQVYSTGESYIGKELPIYIAGKNGVPDREAYFNFIYQPYRDAKGKVEGVIIFGYEVSDLIDAQQSLARQAERFRLLLESIPQMAWTATPAGEIDYLNSRWYSYSGQTEQEALESGWINITHPEDVAAILPSWQHALQTATLYQVECRYKRAEDGAWRWHLVRALPLQSDTGKVFLWVGTCTDIHEEKLFTEQLLEREAYFREMSDKVPMMIWVTKADGTCVYLNKGWYDYTGQTKEEALGLGWLRAIHPQDFQHSQEIFLKANSEQKSFSILYRLKSWDGKYRWFLDKGEPRYDSAGNFEGFVGAVIDVDEQKRIEERLLLSVKAGKVGIFDWDIVHNRASYSDLLQEMFGFEKGTLKENFEGAYQVFQHVMHPEDRQHVNEQVEKALADAQSEFYIEYRVVRPSGQTVWIAERGEVIFEDGQAIRMNGTCIDITGSKKAEEATQRLSEELAAANEELRAANEEIQAANEELSESNRQLAHINADLDRTNRDLDNFVYTASHDLKAPILNLEGLLKALERNLRVEMQQNNSLRQLYELLYASVTRFKITIRDLTEIARINKENPEDIATQAIEEVLEEVLQDLSPQIQEASAQLETSLECGQINFSRKNLKSIIYNLLSNAIKYRSFERELLVRINCQTQESYHVLAIEDNGLGIDMRQENKIFALFKRLHTHVEGTGIGLYIVKKLVENAGGRIEVESRVGVGSVFRVYFIR